MHPTTPNPRNLKALKIFLWIVWILNLALYTIFGLLVYSIPADLLSDPGDATITCIYTAVILFPVIFIGFAQSVIRNSFPDKELMARKRRLYNILVVIQFIVVTAIGAFGGFVLFRVLPEDFRGDTTSSFILMTSLWAIAMMAASGMNLVATILIFRTMRSIRRNFQIRLLESFESL